jgi:ArsR family transcriptional regulator
MHKTDFYFLDPKSSSLKLVAEFWKEAEQMAQLCPITKKEAT